MPAEQPTGMPSTTALILVGALGVLLVIVIALIIIARRRPKGTSTLEARLAEYSDRETPITLEEIELSASFTERVIYPAIDGLSKFVAQFTPARTLENTRHKLDLADNPGNLTPANFLAVRFVAMFVLGGLVLGLMIIAKLPLTRRILFTVVSTALGFYLPVLWLGSKIRGRQKEVVKQLPDTLDLLTICVEAGLGFDQAVQKVVEKSDNELSRACNRYLQEVRLGKPRREALQSMSDRLEVPDVTTFIAAIIQASDLGVSMAKILRIQSEQMRVRRRQRAEQEAHRAPIKMLFPMAFLIFPSIFIVLLGPAILLLMESNVLGSVI
jgi:tight adherence protein C